MRFYLVMAAILGLTATIFGALGAHALKSVLTASQLDSWQTAVRFQFYHCFAMFITVLLHRHQMSIWLKRAAVLFLSGTFAFSGSIYLLLLCGWSFLGPVTPLGGLLLMAGWLSLLIFAYNAKQEN
ncbi:DUF423 domain-containing protein [Neptunicella marina]|uniref:DUF423 domain-containing protein n=1 Tax=Neptunicella marina TaxID=2125989 RepID=A0A8J6IR82_9ALTE|nr:DUF423 domain-containing protein [Neptunicella marina]MBC3764355.1 DUF423 domain-containing protein [Neptunicella marina]